MFNPSLQDFMEIMPFPDEVVYKIYDCYVYASEKLRLDNMSHISNDWANHLWNEMLQSEEDYFIADSLEQIINHKEEDSLSWALPFQDEQEKDEWIKIKMGKF